MRKLYRKQEDGAGWLVVSGGGYQVVYKRRSLVLMVLAALWLKLGGSYWYGLHQRLLTKVMHLEYGSDPVELDNRLRRENAWFNINYCNKPVQFTMPSYLARLKFRQSLNQALIKLGRMVPANKLVI